MGPPENQMMIRVQGSECRVQGLGTTYVYTHMCVYKDVFLCVYTCITGSERCGEQEGVSDQHPSLWSSHVFSAQGLIHPNTQTPKPNTCAHGLHIYLYESIYI